MLFIFHQRNDGAVDALGRIADAELRHAVRHPRHARIIPEQARGGGEKLLAVQALLRQHERRAVVASMLVHISNGLYTVGHGEGATNAVIRAEVRQALLAYIEPLIEGDGR